MDHITVAINGSVAKFGANSTMPKAQIAASRTGSILECKEIQFLLAYKLFIFAFLIISS